MREQKQRDKEEEKRRQEAAELKLVYVEQHPLILFVHLEITHLLCNMTRCDQIR